MGDPDICREQSRFPFILVPAGNSRFLTNQRAQKTGIPSQGQGKRETGLLPVNIRVSHLGSNLDLKNCSVGHFDLIMTHFWILDIRN